jgi:hypothetical protein
MNGDKIKINMIGGGFQHSISSGDLEPKYVEWVRHGAPISMYIDGGIKVKVNSDTQNYGWLSESRTIIGSTYTWARENIPTLKSNFIKVFTHDAELAKISDIFQLTQTGGRSRMEFGDIYPKTKLVSMIASNKVMCEEHVFRQNVIKKYKGKCDHFGRGFNEIADKKDGLKDYCFSFALENGTYPNMYSEKITDCFMTGTIPIYYGIDNIGDYFNTDGIIRLTDDFKVEDLSFDLYHSKLDAIKDNFERGLNILLSEDFIYINFIKNK